MDTTEMDTIEINQLKTDLCPLNKYQYKMWIVFMFELEYISLAFQELRQANDEVARAKVFVLNTQLVS